jgi:hypothetical protein
VGIGNHKYQTNIFDAHTGHHRRTIVTRSDFVKPDDFVKIANMSFGI